MRGAGAMMQPVRAVLLSSLLLAAAAAPASAQSTITLCHATGAASVPYVVAVVPVDNPLGHDAHPDDLIPAPASGCPSTVATYGVPTPAPTAAPTAAPADGTTICHAVRGGYVTLTVSEQGLREHRGHARDRIPAPAGGCPAYTPPTAPVDRDAPPAPAAPTGGALPTRTSQGATAPRRRAAVTRAADGTLPMTGDDDSALILLVGAGLILMGTGGRLLVPAPGAWRR